MTVVKSSPPQLNEIGDITLPLPEIYPLENGIPLYLINGGSENILKLEIILPAGTWQENERLVALSTSTMLKEGTNDHSAKQLADKIDYLGATIRVETFPDHGIVTLFCLNKFLEELLPIVKEIITQPSFPEKELDIYVRNGIQKLKVNNQKNDFVARKKFNETIFGPNNPYGYYGGEKDYLNLKREALSTFHETHYQGDNCMMILSGKINKRLKTLVDTHFGNKSWITGVEKIDKNHEFQPDDLKAHYSSKEGSVQSAIRIGKLLFTKTHPDFSGMAVLNTILGGYYGSRLMSNLRQEKGFTYGVYSGISTFKQNGYFFVTTEVNADNRKDAVNEIYREMERLQENKIEEKELSLVRNYLMGSVLGQVDGPFSVATTVKGLLTNDLEFDYFYHIIDTIQTISAEKLRSLAQQYLSRDTMYEVVVG